LNTKDRIDAAKKRIKELKTLIKLWSKNSDWYLQK
tara:strand:+ start:142 stop:246 length:105 start_codon:yes stop_codon:yes gene_type:complete